jgi:hypothetical protein
MALLILNIKARWRCDINFRLRPLYPRVRTPVSVEEEVDLTPQPVQKPILINVITKVILS